ncbi:hypothetical protein U9M48_041146 [Paspalum notatum var. saurae]|uniref:Uncharacterized protein n=1 Tax=Paspalum notatum var. saurae TaxID=547442 RepID=A0AAQ3UPQ4_PASNO
MDKRTKVLICAAAAYMVLSMMALIIESRKRKRGAGRAEEDEAENKEGQANGVGDGPSTQDSQGATSSSSVNMPNKRARTAEIEEKELIAAFKHLGDKLVKAIEKVAKVGCRSRDNDVPEDLFDNINSLPGFDATHKNSYFVFLVANPHIGRAFNKLPFKHKLRWVDLFISGKFPGQ